MLLVDKVIGCASVASSTCSVDSISDKDESDIVKVTSSS